MNNILAAKVLMSHLPEITDGAYKTATEIAIVELLKEEIRTWEEYYSEDLTLFEYLQLSQEKYDYWIKNIFGV